jgi:hypothetical protein
LRESLGSRSRVLDSRASETGFTRRSRPPRGLGSLLDYFQGGGKRLGVFLQPPQQARSLPNKERAQGVHFCDNTDSVGGYCEMWGLQFGISDSLRLRDSLEADGITAEERAEWLVGYILLHQGEERRDLLRRAVDQFLAAEAFAFERGRRAG